MIKQAKKYDIYIRSDGIWGYLGDKAVFRITKFDEGKYEAEDYLAGWISPPLDIVGAWNLAQEVGITKEEFEKAFGELPSEIEVSIERFVRWFFVNGQLPIGIDEKLEGSIYQYVCEGIIEFYKEELSDYIEKSGLDLIKDEVDDVVYDYLVYKKGLYDVFDEASVDEILFSVLEPVFGEYIEIDERAGVVRIKDLDGFMDYCRTEDAFYSLYETVEEFVLNRISVDLYELLQIYKEVIGVME